MRRYEGPWWGKRGAIQQPVGGGDDRPLASDALLDVLVANDSLAVIYVAGTGDDDQGDGSQANPFREVQRAIDAIPYGCRGYVEIRMLDAGPFVCSIDAPDLRVPVGGWLNIGVVGAGTAELSLDPLPAATHPVNPSGGDKSTIWTYASVGAHTAAAGTHWVRGRQTFGDGFWTFGFTVDDVHGASPDVAVANPVELSTWGLDQGIDLVPFTSQMTCPAGGYAGLVTCDIATGRQALYCVGLDFSTILSAFLTSTLELRGAIALSGCKGAEDAVVVYGDLVSGGVALDAFFPSPVYLFGATPNTYYYVYGIAPQVRAFGGYTLPTLMLRGASSPKLWLNHPTFAYAQAGADVGSDFEGGGTCIRADNTILTVGSNGPCSVDGAATFLQASRNTHALSTAGALFGSTSGVCVVLEDGSMARGFDDTFNGSAPNLRNATTPSDDVKVGSLAAQSFASLPSTDPDQLCRGA